MTTCSVDMLNAPALPVAKPRLGIGVLAAACVAGALVGRLVYLADPFGGDGAMFAYMGKLVADGGRIGEDLIDNKLPSVGFITSVFWRAFGTWWPGYVITQMLMAFAASALVARSAGRVFGEHARWATFLLALTLMNFNAAVMAGFQLETIQTFFACIAAACAMEAIHGRDWRDALAAGMAAGCAVLIKPTGAGVIAAFILAMLMTRRTRDNGCSSILTAAIAGCLIPISACLGYLWYSQQLAIIPQISQQISEYAANTSFNSWDLFRPLSLIVLFAAAMGIRGWVYRRRSIHSEGKTALWIFAITWLAIEFAGVLMQRRMYAYHFLPLAAPAALVFGALPRRTTAGQLAGVLAIPLFLGAWGSAETYAIAKDHPSNWPQVTAWLVEHSQPGEHVWRDQTMYVALHSDLRPASRLQLTFLFMNSNDAPQRFSRMLLDDFARTRPLYVVLPASVEEHIRIQTTCVLELERIPARRENFARAWRDISAFVEADYRPVETIGDETIWVRKDRS